MPSDFFLAQTMAEIHQSIPTEAKKAWMGCHFSPYSTGLSNFPRQLPPESMLIVTDQVPAAGHDPERIAAELQDCITEFGCSCALLDFQRPQIAESAAIAATIVRKLSCPVGVSHWYAKALDCPVFLPPFPLNKTPESHIASWQGRDIWLEAAKDCAAYTVTKDGCTVSQCADTGVFPHFDEALFCHYRIALHDDSAVFTLRRNWEAYLSLKESRKIQCLVGLFQEFAHAEAQAIARDQ